MSFLAPWLLAAGLGAIALPILFHLFRRTPRGRMPFSTLMFLTPSPPQVTRRSRLENWPLLLLRAVILVLLAMAFGRPLWRQLVESQSDPSAGVRTVLLVDTSASMRRSDAWNRAVAEAQKIADSAGPHDELALLTFDSAVEIRLPLSEWRAAAADRRPALVRAALSTLKPTWSGTRLDRGLIEAAELLETADAAAAESNEESKSEATAAKQTKRIVLVTDLQSGARIAGLEGYEWPKQIDVRVIATAVPTANAGVHPLAMVDDSKESGVRPRVMLVNSSDSSKESFQLSWKTKPAATPTPSTANPSGTAGAKSTAPPSAMPTATSSSIPSAVASATAANSPAPPAPSADAYVPPGKVRIVRAPPIPPGDFAELVLSGDDEPFDNRLWYVPPSREIVRVLHLAREPRDDPQSLRYFLERALADEGSTERVAVETVDPTAAGIRAPDAAYLDDVGLMVLALDAPLPEPWLAAPARWIEEGGVAVAVLDEKSSKPSADAAWRKLLPTELSDPRHIAVAEPSAKVEFALLSQIDLRHPLFAPLNDPRFSDFTKIRFWRHRELTLDAEAAAKTRVLARFDGGSPALVEVPRGKGRLFLLASGWQPRESQLGVSSKFVPLLLTMVDLGRRRPRTAAQYEVGDEIPLHFQRADVADRKPGKVRTATGREAPLPAESSVYRADDGPGIYEFHTGEVYRVAVNVPAEESKTVPLETAALEAVGVRLVKDVPEPTPELQAERRTLQLAEMEARQQLWRPLLAAAIGLAIVETWVAGRSAGRDQLAPQPEASK
jgi:hypothetical protein